MEDAELSTERRWDTTSPQRQLLDRAFGDASPLIDKAATSAEGRRQLETVLAGIANRYVVMASSSMEDRATIRWMRSAVNTVVNCRTHNEIAMVMGRAGKPAPEDDVWGLMDLLAKTSAPIVRVGLSGAGSLAYVAAELSASAVTLAEAIIMQPNVTQDLLVAAVRKHVGLASGRYASAAQAKRDYLLGLHVSQDLRAPVSYVGVAGLDKILIRLANAYADWWSSLDDDQKAPDDLLRQLLGIGGRPKSLHEILATSEDPRQAVELLNSQLETFAGASRKRISVEDEAGAAATATVVSPPTKKSAPPPNIGQLPQPAASRSRWPELHPKLASSSASEAFKGLMFIADVTSDEAFAILAYLHGGAVPDREALRAGMHEIELFFRDFQRSLNVDQRNDKAFEVGYKVIKSVVGIDAPRAASFDVALHNITPDPDVQTKVREAFAAVCRRVLNFAINQYHMRPEAVMYDSYIRYSSSGGEAV